MWDIGGSGVEESIEEWLAQAGGSSHGCLSQNLLDSINTNLLHLRVRRSKSFAFCPPDCKIPWILLAAAALDPASPLPLVHIRPLLVLGSCCSEAEDGRAGDDKAAKEE